MCCIHGQSSRAVQEADERASGSAASDSLSRTPVEAMGRLAIIAAAIVHAHKHCVDDYDGLKAHITQDIHRIFKTFVDLLPEAGDRCKATWNDLTSGAERPLLPTQPLLGYAWAYEQQKRHFSSKKHAEESLKPPG